MTILILFSFTNIIIADEENLNQEMYNHINRKILRNPKLEQCVENLIRDFNTGELQYISESPVGEFNFINEKVRLEIILSNKDQIDSLYEFNNEIEIEKNYKSIVQVLVPLNLINNLSQEDYIQFIRKPINPILMDVTSEGVSTINADTLHYYGFYGNGSKVAIIDLGFLEYEINPEIPSERIADEKSFRSDEDLEWLTKHGCACAEIVLDVAPQADLYLYNFETISDLNESVNYAISAGVDIISFSFGYNYINNFDGIGYDEIGNVCEIVDNARSNGVLVVTAAGNEADHHYESSFTDNNNNSFHEFGNGDEELDLGYLPKDTYYHFELTWNDWPFSDQDYDLCLRNSSNNITDLSYNIQNGSQPPNEWFFGNIPKDDWYYIEIRKYDATEDVDFELYGNDEIPFIEYNIPESSLVCPADANGALSAGATYWEDDLLEYYSSRGPTNDGRIKPDITSPDGVSTYTYDTENFFGTSASSPHAAGAAALLKSVNVSLTADDLQDLIENTAFDLGILNKDNLYGSGRIDVLAAFNVTFANPNTTYVDDDYNESTIGWQIDHFDHIQDGINRVANNGTVFVFNGRYYENVLVNKTINLIGQDRNNTIIDGSGKDNALEVTSDFVNISGFNIQNASENGIIINSKNNSVFDNTIYFNDKCGLYVNNQDNIISNNNFINNGLQLADSYHTTINDNFINGKPLIYYEEVTDLVISGNSGQIILNRCNNITITNQDLFNTSIGIQLVETNNSSIFQNTFSFLSNYGMYLIDSYHNFIYHNNFLDNVENAYSISDNFWNNSYPMGGNYWDDYGGVDSDGDGIGDTPYFLQGGSEQDEYPLMHQWGENPPVANFNFDNDVFTVSFNGTLSYDRDGNIISYIWDFGDGFNSSEQNPTHSYDSDGTYIVNLSVIDDESLIGNVSKSVVVDLPAFPVADFTWSPEEPIINDTIEFIDNSDPGDGDIISWFWEFGDGSNSNDKNPTHPYIHEGTYEINLSVTNEYNLTNNVSKTITVYPPSEPTSSFSWSPINPVETEPIQFNDTSNPRSGNLVNWTWEFGDGNSFNEQNTTYSYISAGIYQVNLTVKNEYGLSNTSSRSITIIPPTEPTADFSWAPNPPIINQSTQFTDTSIPGSGQIVSWSWDFGDGSDSDDDNPTHQFSSLGNFTVSLNVTNTYGLYDEKSISITVNLPTEPDADFTWSPSSPLKGQSVQFTDTSTPGVANITSWLWDFGDNTNSNLKNPTHSYSTTGTFTVNLTIEDSNGATDSKVKTITIRTQSSGGGGSDPPPYSPPPIVIPQNHPPVADASKGEPYEGYVREKITFDGSSSYDPDEENITTWLWNFGDGSNGTGEITTHTYNKPDSYNVILTVKDEAKAQGTCEISAIIIQPNRPPSNPDLSGPMAGTKNKKYIYSAKSTDKDNDTLSYKFNWGDGTSNTTEFIKNATTAIYSHLWEVAGKYTITVSAYDNQTYSDTTQIILLIDAIITGEIGYITDDDADGTYDTFHSKDLTTRLKQEGEKYIIDIDGDGEWDYSYDMMRGLSVYEEAGFSLIVLAGLIMSLAIVGNIYYIFKKKQKNK